MLPAQTLAPSYRAHATQESGKVAASAEERKCEKYQGFPPGHFFTPVAIETLGAIGLKSMVFLRDLGRRIRTVTDEPKSTDYLLQRISVAVQPWKQYCGAGQHGRLTLFSSVCWFVVLLFSVVFKIHGSKILITPPHQFIFFYPKLSDFC